VTNIFQSAKCNAVSGENKCVSGNANLLRIGLICFTLLYYPVLSPDEKCENFRLCLAANNLCEKSMTSVWCNKHFPPNYDHILWCFLGTFPALLMTTCVVPISNFHHFRMALCHAVTIQAVVVPELGHH
jgi:hypothetical protein